MAGQPVTGMKLDVFAHRAECLTKCQGNASSIWLAHSDPWKKSRSAQLQGVEQTFRFNPKKHQIGLDASDFQTCPFGFVSVVVARLGWLSKGVEF
eukprot:778926-Amphidinium_carterae.1